MALLVSINISAYSSKDAYPKLTVSRAEPDEDKIAINLTNALYSFSLSKKISVFPLS